MSESKRDIHLFEAIELRNEYDRTIKLLEKLLGTGGQVRNGREAG